MAWYGFGLVLALVIESSSSPSCCPVAQKLCPRCSPCPLVARLHSFDSIIHQRPGSSQISLPINITINPITLTLSASHLLLLVRSYRLRNQHQHPRLHLKGRSISRSTHRATGHLHPPTHFSASHVHSPRLPLLTRRIDRRKQQPSHHRPNIHLRPVTTHKQPTTTTSTPST